MTYLVHRWPLWLAALTIAARAPLAHGAPVIFVHAGALGANDGSTWPDAYRDLQDALDHAATIASPTNPIEIWVAEGVYTPDRGTGDRWLSFRLLSHVSLYGGFAGHEIALTQRNIAAQRTVISGDLNGDDDPDAAVISPCCTVSGPFSCDDSNCVAAVVKELSGAPNHYDCANEWESFCAVVAQGACCDLCRPTRCDNSNNLIGAEGIGESSTFDGFVVSGGEASGREFSSAPPDAVFGSCGGLTARNSSLIIRNCDFSDNAGASGAAFYAIGGQPTVTNTSFTRNRTYRGVLAAVKTFSNVSFIDCLFTANTGMGLQYDSGTREIRRCQFLDNTSTGILIGGSAAPNIIDCLIAKNQASHNGGGIMNYGFPGIINTQILGNKAGAIGGGIDSFGNGLIIINSVISGNVAGTTGAIWHFGGTATILNSTIINNYADTTLGGFLNSTGAVIHNSIFWGNSDSGMHGLSTLQNQISETTTFLDLYYSNIEGWDGSRPGEGIIGVEPLFVDEFGPDGMAGTFDDDLHLSALSPLINAGHPSPPLVPYLDGDGHTRILCGRVDMGAYEFGIADSDCNGIVDLFDFMTFAPCMNGPDGLPVPTLCEAFDFNADNLIDLSDLAGFQNTLHAP